jgi:hypothetical protein
MGMSPTMYLSSIIFTFPTKILSFVSFYHLSLLSLLFLLSLVIGLDRQQQSKGCEICNQTRIVSNDYASIVGHHVYKFERNGMKWNGMLGIRQIVFAPPQFDIKFKSNWISNRNSATEKVGRDGFPVSVKVSTFELFDSRKSRHA